MKQTCTGKFLHLLNISVLGPHSYVSAVYTVLAEYPLGERVSARPSIELMALRVCSA